MRGRQILMESLIAQGVSHIFGNPGTTESPIIDSLLDYPQSVDDTRSQTWPASPDLRVHVGPIQVFTLDRNAQEERANAQKPIQDGETLTTVAGGKRQVEPGQAIRRRFGGRPAR